MTNKVRNIQQLARYIENTRSKILRGHAETMMKVVAQAEANAKAIAKNKFIGRNGRKLTGRLLNSINSGFYTINKTQSLPRGYIGTKGIPYGRIHELGGTIIPKKAKFLWMKDHTSKKHRRMTPTEFIQSMKKDDRFQLRMGTKGGVAGYLKGRRKKKKNMSISDFQVLFRLTKKVRMPKRPFLQPAANKAAHDYKVIAKKIFRSNLGRKP